MDKYIQLVKAHQTLVLGLATLGVILYISSAFINRSADKANTANVVAQQELSNQRVVVDQLQKQVDAQQHQFQTIIDGLTRQNQNLLAQISARNTQAVQEQKKDAELPPMLFVQKWTELAKLSPDNIKPVENGYEITSPAAIQTVQTLELLPVIQQNLTDIQNLVKNKDTEIQANHDLLATVNKQNGELKAQVTLTEKACTTSVDALKAENKKKNKSWFLKGIAVGAGILAYILH